MEAAKEKFDLRVREAIDWAVDDGLSIADMQAVLREYIETMDLHPDEFRPID